MSSFAPSRWAVILGGLCLLALPASAAAQAPFAAWPFDAQANTAGDQHAPAVAMEPRGTFVVVWASDDGSGDGVYARRFDARARPLGLEFRVNGATTGAQQVPDVARDERGRTVIVWQDDAADGDQAGIVARRFDATGAPRGAEFVVNLYTTGAQTAPSVAVDGAGRFVVAWQSAGQDGSGGSIVARRFDAAGAAIGGEFVVNAYTTGDQVAPAVAAPANGTFVITWGGVAAFTTPRAAFARRFGADGTPLGGELRVDSSLPETATEPDVAAAADGAFVVIWRESLPLSRVAGRSFDADGVPRGAPFTVEALPLGTPSGPAVVAADATGSFIAVWQTNDPADPGYGIGGRRFEANGTIRDGLFRANEWTTTGAQLAPAIAAEPSGNFVVTWTSNHVDLVTRDVMGQTFGGMFPGSPLYVDLAATTTSDGNRVFEPNETIEIYPSWRNESFWRSQGSFRTRFAAVTGPPVPGGGYTFSTGLLSYPPIDGFPGEEESSINGGLVGVTALVRPVLHWDATVTEDVQSAGQGQRKMWPMHIGESFSDVPRTNGFYRFVETLLHHGLTSGCGGGAYCAGASMSRAQMAVFVIVAKEGLAYLPPACGATPLFPDVPTSDPFCRWIEELARRSVVSGCGGGNYCPSLPVSREQMTVFVLRALDPALTPAPCTTPPYADVPVSSGFCPWIRELTARGVVSGCGGGLFCPTSPVSREQMGVFIAVTFGLTLYGP